MLGIQAASTGNYLKLFSRGDARVYECAKSGTHSSPSEFATLRGRRKAFRPKDRRDNRPGCVRCGQGRIICAIAEILRTMRVNRERILKPGTQKSSRLARMRSLVALGMTRRPEEFPSLVRGLRDSIGDYCSPALRGWAGRCPQAAEDSGLDRRIRANCP